jgi:PKHD-type hydroxylase
MLVHIPGVLTSDEVRQVRSIIEAEAWIDGKATAGDQAATAKFNLQIAEGSPAAMQAGDIILKALGRNPLFNSAALPFRVLPPLFNRYDVGMKFDAHVDGAVRMIPHAGIRMRADVSSTLFLTDPGDYDGGELVIEDTYGSHAVKLPAGDLVLYSATSRHHVTPITRGSRWSSFFWIQSMVRDEAARTHLFELDNAIQGLRGQVGDNAEVVALTGLYHNLVRRWADA